VLLAWPQLRGSGHDFARAPLDGDEFDFRRRDFPARLIRRLNRASPIAFLMRSCLLTPARLSRAMRFTREARGLAAALNVVGFCASRRAASRRAASSSRIFIART
jgi:hypothetical protein